MLTGSKCLLLLEASVSPAGECSYCPVLCEFQATAFHLLNVWFRGLRECWCTQAPPALRACPSQADHCQRSLPFPSLAVRPPLVHGLPRVPQATWSTGQSRTLGGGRGSSSSREALLLGLWTVWHVSLHVPRLLWKWESALKK